MDVFHSLVGDWEFVRSFDPGLGEMTGQARFVALDASTLHYREDGQLRLSSGHRSDAWREYYYLHEGETIRVCFADAPPGSRTLHILRLGPDTAAVSDVHVCAADTYTGHYRFVLPTRFEITMTVLGPNKDYSIYTVYTRFPDEMVRGHTVSRAGGGHLGVAAQQERQP